MILVTGATGFVGRSLSQTLLERGHSVRAALRHTDNQSSLPFFSSQVVVGDICGDTDWSEALLGVETVVHLASRVHVMSETDDNPIVLYRHVNVEGTLNLARQAIAAGVKRFVYMSSIKVNGEGGDVPYKETDIPDPQDAYGLSKYEAEVGLRKFASDSGLEVVIIRPPLVYGPGVKANFLTMMRWLSRGIPLPLGGVKNKRSLVCIDNLVDFIITCIIHPRAGNQTFLVSDGRDFSTPELLQALSSCMGQLPILLPIPGKWLEIACRAIGKSSVSDRLCGSLRVDIRKANDELNWQPPVSCEEGFQRVVEWYKTI